MIAIIYLNNKPFYCFQIENFNENILIEKIYLFTRFSVIIKKQIIRQSIIHLDCEVAPPRNIDKNDIAFRSEYKKMGDIVEPIWLCNDQGEELTFLIKE
jgi:hypothetical protein